MAFINCKKCDKRISSNAEACPNCGEPVRLNNNTKPCIECGNILKSTAKKCHECGTLQYQKTKLSKDQRKQKVNSSGNPVLKGLLAILIIIAIGGGFFILLDQGAFSSEIQIDGTYKLASPRPDQALACNLDFTNFGKNITIEGNKLITNPFKGFQKIEYSIEKIEGRIYRINGEGGILKNVNQITCEISEDGLVFNCQGYEIVYQKIELS